jgi:hypothetical protein
MTCTTPEAATPEPPPVVLTGTLSILVARSGRPWLSLAVRHPLHGRPVERRSVHPSPGVEPPAASDSDPLAFKSLAELDQAAAIEKDTD